MSQRIQRTSELRERTDYELFRRYDRTWNMESSERVALAALGRASLPPDQTTGRGDASSAGLVSQPGLSPAMKTPKPRGGNRSSRRPLGLRRPNAQERPVKAS